MKNKIKIRKICISEYTAFGFFVVKINSLKYLQKYMYF